MKIRIIHSCFTTRISVSKFYQSRLITNSCLSPQFKYVKFQVFFLHKSTIYITPEVTENPSLQLGNQVQAVKLNFMTEENDTTYMRFMKQSRN